MSNELTTNWKVSYAKGGTSIDFPDPPHREFQVTVAGTVLAHLRQSIPTSATALNLGGVVTGGYLAIVNRDATNFVSLRSGTGGTNFVKLKAGEGGMFRVSPDTAAPYLIADTAAVEVEYLLLSN